jgi:hypothetical protein
MPWSGSSFPGFAGFVAALAAGFLAAGLAVAFFGFSNSSSLVFLAFMGMLSNI